MSSPFVRDVTDGDFAAAVLARSAEIPVVVDFWAPWCGPCRTLAPILEREVAALAGKVELVKINTDQNPATAGRYGIRGIPAVKAFRDGEEVSELVGAQPASAVRRFLAELVPSPGRSAFAAAEQAMRAGDAAAAEGHLRGLLEEPEVGSLAALALARLLLSRGLGDEVEALLQRVSPADADEQTLEHLRLRRRLIADGGGAQGEAAARAALLADPADLEARWSLAAALEVRGDVAGALEHFLEVVARSRRFRDDGARKAMLAIFDQLGPAHELTGEFRRRLQIYL